MIGRIFSKRVLAASALAAVVGLSFAAKEKVFESNDSKDRKVVSIKLNDYKHDMRVISNMDVDIAGVDLEKGIVDVVVNSSELHSLQTAVDFKVSEVRDAINRAPDSGYHTPEEIEAELKDFAERFPAISKLESIGQTVRGRDIWAMKISDNSQERELSEPTVLFNSMHHAREVMTSEVGMDIVQYLLENYETNDQVRDWVDTTEIWVVPMFNPDGNNIVWTNDSWWRKNARESYGVDLNRNYTSGWGSCGGSSGSRSSQTYRGPSAGSEPETQAMMDLVRRVKPVFDISFHSYSEMVLYPLGCQNEYTVNRDVVEGIGREMARLLPRDNSSSRTYSVGTPWEILYSVDGDDIDWMYNEYDVIAYVIELNGSSQGFQPSYSRWRDVTVEKARASWQYLLDRVHQSGVRGVITIGGEKAENNVAIEIKNMINTSQAVDSIKMAEDSTYHVVLSAGTYLLKFAVEGGRTIEKEVTISDELHRMDIEL